MKKLVIKLYDNQEKHKEYLFGVDKIEITENNYIITKNLAEFEYSKERYDLMEIYEND